MNKFMHYKKLNIERDQKTKELKIMGLKMYFFERENCVKTFWR